jgi:hypothetical protein
LLFLTWWWLFSGWNNCCQNKKVIYIIKFVVFDGNFHTSVTMHAFGRTRTYCISTMHYWMLKYIWPRWLVTIKLLSSQIPTIYTVSFIIFISCCTGGRCLIYTAQIQAFNLKLIFTSAFLNLKTHFYETHHIEFCFHLHPLFSDKSLQLCCR